MHYFDGGEAFSGNSLQGPAPNSNQSFPTPARSFREEYNGVIQGLMSTVQLGYTGVSMIYFLQNVRSMLNDFREKVLPFILNVSKHASSKFSLAVLAHKILSLFYIRNYPEAFIKALALLAVATALYFLIYFHQKRIAFHKKKYCKF